MDVRIREQALPGIGHRYEMLLDRHRVVVVVQRDGRRELAISLSADDTTAAVSFTQDQAIALAAILTGARFSIDTTDDPDIEADEVDVRTVTVGRRSAVIGQTAASVALPSGIDAEILAVIRDDTPELVEDETRAPIRAGDRLVVAARRDQLDRVVDQLIEPARRGPTR